MWALRGGCPVFGVYWISYNWKYEVCSKYHVNMRISRNWITELYFFIDPSKIFVANFYFYSYLLLDHLKISFIFSQSQDFFKLLHSRDECVYHLGDLHSCGCKATENCTRSWRYFPRYTNQWGFYQIFSILYQFFPKIYSLILLIWKLFLCPPPSHPITSALFSNVARWTAVVWNLLQDVWE